jgi:hypothetical protein
VSTLSSRLLDTSTVCRAKSRGGKVFLGTVVILLCEALTKVRPEKLAKGMSPRDVRELKSRRRSLTSTRPTNVFGRRRVRELCDRSRTLML